MPHASAQAHGRVHGEAFMLMWYACKSCGHREQIWNSRDGVTPFGCSCPSCGKGMNHVEWERDVYAPEHQLLPRQRFWRDGTPDEAEAIMRRRIEQMRHNYPCSLEQERELIHSARSEGTAGEFQRGWPMLDESKAHSASRESGRSMDRGTNKPAE